MLERDVSQDQYKLPRFSICYTLFTKQAIPKFEKVEQNALQIGAKPSSIELHLIISRCNAFNIMERGNLGYLL